MSAREYLELLNCVERLESEEQLRLLGDIAAMLRRRNGDRPASILELRGLGKEVWDGVDAQEYVDRERASWNG
ncbi:MAG TPA: hypothetical protein PLE19_19070 [Planctomycetota bacterium]|nr:hypothetical protein [Planctomycetota bacterium]HRR80439.1 hypothetical protein [Planctomycetota bacterium]HRT96629.1 hypothetical protein [Planctomycetota bacterium]